MRTHVIDSVDPEYQPAYLANGFVGLRLGVMPLPGGTCLVNGFCGLSPEKRTEEYAAAPYPLGLDIQIDTLWISQHPQIAQFKAQEYDHSCGELRSKFSLNTGSEAAQVEVITFCSRTKPALVLQECAITVDQPCEIVLQANIDPRGIAGRLKNIFWPGWDHNLRKHIDRDAVLEWESLGALGTVGLSYAAELIGGPVKGRHRNNYAHEMDMALTNFTFDAIPGTTYRLRQYTGLVPSLLHDEPHWQAAREVGVGVDLGFEQLREDNRAAWAELWKGCPRITSQNEKWQELTEAAYFYLHSSAHAATPCSVAPFGLGSRSEYSGHVFWDCESFMFPPVLLTNPDAARAMLDYRFDRLPAARNNARINGYRGVQFPWQSGLTGCEVAPYYTGACGGVTEQHINMDVAFAFAQFAHASGDEVFLREKAWPVLSGVADWIASRVTKTERGYEIQHVTGIDEGIDDINNNSHTNIAAIVILREAAQMAQRLGYSAPANWTAIAKDMFLPIDPETKVMLKHDTYRYKGGMCCPETMAGYFPLNYRHSPEVDKATAHYHLDLAETYFGMPMLSALYAVWACREGDRELATKFFEMGAMGYLIEPYNQFCEISKRVGKEGSFLGRFNGKTVFLTNPAGFLMSLMFGLPDLKLGAGDPTEWATEPVVLPAGWEQLELPRFFARGSEWSLTVRHGERPTIKKL